MADLPTYYTAGSGYVTGINALDSPTMYVVNPLNDLAVWHPPTLAQPAVPAIPPTPAQIKKIKNMGWNTWARSVGALEVGSYYKFNVMTGVSGALLGIAPKGSEGLGINALSHAIISDLDGIKIRENGLPIATLKTAQRAASILRIYRQTDGTIVYVATTAYETIVHTSSLPYSTVKVAYVYGNLYASGDRVLSSSLNTGVVGYGSM